MARAGGHRPKAQRKERRGSAVAGFRGRDCVPRHHDCRPFTDVTAGSVFLRLRFVRSGCRRDVVSHQARRRIPRRRISKKRRKTCAIAPPCAEHRQVRDGGGRCVSAHSPTLGRHVALQQSSSPSLIKTISLATIRARRKTGQSRSTRRGSRRAVRRGLRARAFAFAPRLIAAT